VKRGGSKDVGSFDRRCRVTAMLGTPATQLFKKGLQYQVIFKLYLSDSTKETNAERNNRHYRW
jgi:hypothetical protein